MIDKLHFIRPDWFYAFIPLALFMLLMLRKHGRSLSWSSVCDAKLLPYILTSTTNKANRAPLLLIAIAASLSIIAAAGPVFEKIPQPVFREQSSLVVILDLSQSMDATDLRPSRVERAKLKLLDILKSRKGGQTALITYAANAYTVTPLTDDTNTIANLVPTLKTELMPVQGSRTYTAINKAAELFQQAGANSGDALLMTDGMSSKDYEAINTFASQGHRLSILGIGTTDGSPVPLSNGGFLQDNNGAIVIPRLNPKQLQQAAAKAGGIYVSLQADDSDIERLTRFFTSSTMKPESESPTLGEMKLTADTWQEEGPWLLLFVIPIAALWSRKGWLLCIPLIALTSPETSYALNVDNLWSSSDQKAMRTLNNGDASKAAEQFENPRWKSSAHYRAGNYEQALENLRETITSDDFYNKGNTLAKLGRFPEAIQAYDEAIALDANHEDANYNRELVKKEMQKQQDNSQSDQSQNGEQQEGEQQDEQSQDEQGSKDQQQENSASQEENSADNNNQPKQQAEPSENKSSEDQSSPEKETTKEDEVKQALQDAQQQEQSNEKEDTDGGQEDQTVAMSQEQLNENLNEDEQATEQWLKRIPDDPGQLLRRKFLYQYKNMQNQTTDEQPW